MKFDKKAIFRMLKEIKKRMLEVGRILDRYTFETYDSGEVGRGIASERRGG